MRELIVQTFVSMDGVMQAPGGPKEDTSGGFKYGGWTFPYFDKFAGEVMGKIMGKPFDLLLGRKTYEIFSSYWPTADEKKEPLAKAINDAKKYVASRKLKKVNWKNSIILKGNVVSEIKKLKKQNGPEIQVPGSSDLIQTLLKNSLIDKLILMIFPVTLGKGKKLFGTGTLPAGFKLIESKTSPSGVIIATYIPAGKVKTGSFA